MRRVLVVDDEDIVRDVLSEMVETAGPYKAETAVDGMDGLDKISGGAYDIVFTDLKMPNLGGIAFMERLRELNPAIPVVVVTAHSHLDTALSAMREGASDFITKPFNFSDIKYVLERVSRERDILKSISDDGDRGKLIKTLNSALYKKLHEINNLFAISLELDELRDNNSVYERLPSMVARLLKARTVILMRAENDSVVADHCIGEVLDFEMPIAGSVFGEVADRRMHRLIQVGERSPIYGTVLKTDFLIIPLLLGEEILGFLCVTDKSEIYSFTDDEVNLATTLMHKVSLRLENNALYEVTCSNLINTLETLVLTIEARDSYTKKHSERVTSIALEIAGEVECTTEETDAIRFGGYLHDIGKIGVRDMILLKPSRLTDAEFEEIKKHPVIGDNIVSPLGSFPMERLLIRHHHERFDGKGYPDGLAGEDIPRIARILSVADTYDSMTSTRPYRTGLRHDVAIDEIKRCAGTQFDPEIVRAFIQTPTGQGGGD